MSSKRRSHLLEKAAGRESTLKMSDCCNFRKAKRRFDRVRMAATGTTLKFLMVSSLVFVSRRSGLNFSASIFSYLHVWNRPHPNLRLLYFLSECFGHSCINPKCLGLPCDRLSVVIGPVVENPCGRVIELCRGKR